MAISLLVLSSGLVANGLRPVGQVATPTRVQSVAMSSTADPARKKIPAKCAAPLALRRPAMAAAARGRPRAAS